MKSRQLYKNVIYFIGSLLLAIAAGTLLMILVYCIPVAPIRQHVRDTVQILTNEGDYYFWAPNYSASELDNFTDACMLNEASFVGSGSVVQDAMNNPSIWYEDQWSSAMRLSLAVNADGIEESASIANYSRYWHGYLVLLKPLLYFLNISDIRILNMGVQLFLLAYLLIELYKLGGYRLVWPMVIAAIFLNPISTAMCLQFTDVYVITLIGSLVILRRGQGGGHDWRIFLWTGIAIAYFDFLTYPILSLGVMLLILLYLHREDDLRTQVRRIVTCSVNWGGWLRRHVARKMGDCLDPNGRQCFLGWI